MSATDQRKTTRHDKTVDHLEYIKALDRSTAIAILLKLCKDKNYAGRIITMAKASLSKVDVDCIADEVFRTLNSIQIEELWDNSGKTRWGYQEPTEVAFEMIGDALNKYIQKMEQYAALGMKEEEKAYCKGMIIGLLRYGAEGNNEFHEAVPDDPYTHAENILDDWGKDHTTEDIEEVQEIYDSFFSNTDS